MFFRILLNQFVCIHKLGKITEIDSLAICRNLWFISIRAFEILAVEESWASPHIL
jgi:hypothetical protein